MNLRASSGYTEGMDRDDAERYPREERLAFLYGAWAALAVEPFTNAAALQHIERQVGAILGPAACSDRGNPAIAHARGER